MIRSKAIILALVFVVAAPTAAVAQEPQVEPRDTVTVAASKDVDVEPDIGTVSFGIRVNANDAAGAADKLTNRTRRVIDALKTIGFNSDEIDTYDVELARTCLDRCRDPNPKDDKIPEPVMGYRGSSGLRVETSQLNRLGEVIDAAVDAGANNVRGISFDVKDRSEAVKEALRQAMVFATEKAQILAETGGRQLGPALQILEGRTRAPEPADFDGALGGRVSGGGSSGGGGGDNPFPIEPPTLSASARVTVTYELL
ncbi:MAG TPA: SIMPL domain-containing protein [Actinomycetota bacterium]|nr:SIMPL domain-containing protein [Actinomycetota bacterium]